MDGVLLKACIRIRISSTIIKKLQMIRKKFKRISYGVLGDRNFYFKTAFRNISISRNISLAVFMDLMNFSIYEYSVPMKKPMFWDKRQGFFIVIFDDLGCKGVGEAAPLPGYSRENIESVRKQLFECVEGKIPEIFFPSVRMGMEMAMLDLTKRQTEVTLRHLFSESFLDVIEIGRLLLAEDSCVFEKFLSLLKEGNKTIRLKVGRQEVEKDLKVVQNLCKKIDEEVSLSLDVDGIWDINTAVDFGKKCSSLPIKYIEEPINDPKHLRDFFFSTGIQVALDQTLIKYPDVDLNGISGLHSITLKPTVLGGFDTVGNWINRAKEIALPFIISSSFETSFGILSLANFFAAVSNESSLAGIDTFSLFSDDVFSVPLVIKEGKLDLNAYDKSEIDFSKEWIKRIA